MTASFVSANYWRRANCSWRRNMDLILSKIIFVVFYLKGLFAVTYFPYVLSIYVVGPLVGFFIIQSNLLWEKKNKHWVKYHFLFHVTLVYLLLIVFTHHKRLFSISNLQGIFTQNLETEPTDILKPLPIGIANSMYPHGHLSSMTTILRQPCKKTEKVYSQFRIDTNVAKRKKCFDIISSKGIVTQPSCEYLDYLKLLSTFEFAICPEGNGIDTHRFWECVYLQTIPICLKNHLTEYYSQFFPIVLLNSWEELDITMLVYDQWPTSSVEMLDVDFFFK